MKFGRKDTVWKSWESVLTIGHVLVTADILVARLALILKGMIAIPERPSRQNPFFKTPCSFVDWLFWTKFKILHVHGSNTTVWAAEWELTGRVVYATGVEEALADFASIGGDDGDIRVPEDGSDATNLVCFVFTRVLDNAVSINPKVPQAKGLGDFNRITNCLGDVLGINALSV